MRTLPVFVFALISVFFTHSLFGQQGDSSSTPTQTLPKKDVNRNQEVLRGQQKSPANSRRRSRPSIPSRQRFEVQYSSSSWNLNSRKIDTATLLVLEARSGKMAQINLEETAPDSSVFSGRFQLNWGDLEKISPEIYVPPPSLRGKEDRLNQMRTLIQQKKLPRKPYIFRSFPDGRRIMEVFDSSAEASQALKASKAAQNKKKAQRLKKTLSQNEKVAAEAVFEAEQLAAVKAAQARLAELTAQRETERLRLARLEKQKQEQRIARERQMALAEKKRRRQRAAVLAQEATKHYRAGEFEKAVQLFEQSIDLDPENKVYYYQYGVSLYKLERFNSAIVILNEASGEQVIENERDYFIGLAHLRLQEFEPALSAFEKVKKSSDPTLSPSAAFYQGVIFFDTQNYEEAKPQFEFVLDQSQDPRLDERAERYIERIIQILAFAEQQKIKFFLSGTLGLQYDSNVLFNSDSSIDEGTATGEGGARLLALTEFQWRPIYLKHHELKLDLDLTYYYSFDDVFTAADPFLFNASVPYVYKGTFLNKGYKFEVSPGYETLYMDLEETGTRENIQDSLILETTHTFVLDAKWFTDVEINYRRDNSHVGVTDPEDDSSAHVYFINNDHTLFLDQQNTLLALATIGYRRNQADGNNNVYDRLDLSGSYVHPLSLGNWQISAVHTLATYYSIYGERDDDRKDLNYALSSSLSKKWGKYWSLGLSAGYTKNDSNVDSFTYTQWNVMTSMSFDYSF